MTHAELLRSHADAALRDGGMYYSGECLSRIAATAESLEAENAKLRELLSSYWKRTHSPVSPNVERDYLLEMRELGIEVDE